VTQDEEEWKNVCFLMSHMTLYYRGYLPFSKKWVWWWWMVNWEGWMWLCPPWRYIYLSVGAEQYRKTLGLCGCLANIYTRHFLHARELL